MSDEFYNIEATLSEKESFDNTILLLTMVKKEYYYIVGFSRLASTIRIGLDFESMLHDKITEYITIYFNADNEKIILESTIENIDVSLLNNYQSLNPKSFFIDDLGLHYRIDISKDKVIPTGIHKMNSVILKARKEIFNFLEDFYMYCICGG